MPRMMFDCSHGHSHPLRAIVVVVMICVATCFPAVSAAIGEEPTTHSLAPIYHTLLPAAITTTDVRGMMPPTPRLHDDITCVNGGEVRDGGQSCACPIFYTGDNCSERQCPNSMGGVAPFFIEAIDPASHKCDHCREGDYTGINCQLCLKDSACTAYAGGEARCNRGIAIQGNQKQFQCQLNSPYFLRLMGDDRDIRADIVLNWSTSDGKAFGSSPGNGLCHMSIYRFEPNDSYVDPFFRCEATSCSMRFGEVEADSGSGSSSSSNDDDDDDKSSSSSSNSRRGSQRPERRYVRYLRVGGQITLIVLCTLLASLGACASSLGPKRLRRLTLSIAAILTLVVVAYIIAMSMMMGTENPEKSVIYECEHTKCACAEDPPVEYQPICSDSPVLSKAILPIIQNHIRFECNMKNQDCKLTLADLALVFDGQCKAAECVNVTAFPINPEDGADTHHSSKGDARQWLIVRMLFGVAMMMCVGVIAHWYVLRGRSRALMLEFDHIFLEDDDEYSVMEGDGEALGDQHPPQAHSALRGASGSPEPRSPGQDDDEDDNDVDAPLIPRHPADAAVEVADLTFEEEASAMRCLARSPIELVVSNLHYTLPSSCFAARDEETMDRAILERIHLSIHSGEMLAIMGPSGAGKTTLLDLLAARAKSGIVEGSVMLNGTPMTANSRSGEHYAAQYRSVIGYVSQEDTLLPALTVRQTIRYAARLKLPTAFSPEAIDEIVTDVIYALRLQRCEHTLVGDGAQLRGISGGEKRRVSIAVELLANPRILFLDEPTSGLDAVSAMRVMEAVADLARHSPMRAYAPHFFSFCPAVIFSIHQPSQEIFALFDKVLLLSQGVGIYCGRADIAGEVLEGRVAAAVAHSRPVPRREEHPNSAEYLMKLEEILDDHSRQELQEEDFHEGVSSAYLQQQRREPHQQGEDAAGAANGSEDEPIMVDGGTLLASTTNCRKYYANLYQQLSLLTARAVGCLIGAFHLVVCHAAVVACLATLMCFLYRAQALDLPGSLNRAGSVTFLLLVTSFVSLSALEQLLVERKLFVVERENGYYSTLPYLLSKLIVDIVPLRVIPAAVLASVIYFPMGFRVDEGSHLLWFVLIIVLFSVAMTLIVLCVGILSGSFGAAALLSSVVILWNFVFGGEMVQFDTIPYVLRPFQLLSPFFLAFESLMVNELNGQACVFSPTDETGKQSSASIPIMCVQYLANVGLKPSRFSVDVMQLGLYCFVLVLVAWVLLATRTKITR